MSREPYMKMGTAILSILAPIPLTKSPTDLPNVSERKGDAPLLASDFK